jgi:hypothetical protein
VNRLNIQALGGNLAGRFLRPKVHATVKKKLREALARGDRLADQIKEFLK